jgi:hypothetical protein
MSHMRAHGCPVAVCGGAHASGRAGGDVGTQLGSLLGCFSGWSCCSSDQSWERCGRTESMG